MMIAVETLSSKLVYTNRWMTVREDEIRRPDGSTGVYGVVDSPDIALIVPSDGDDCISSSSTGTRSPAGAGNSRPEAPTSDSTSTQRRGPPASCAKKPGSWLAG